LRAPSIVVQRYTEYANPLLPERHSMNDVLEMCREMPEI